MSLLKQLRQKLTIHKRRPRKFHTIGEEFECRMLLSGTTADSPMMGPMSPDQIQFYSVDGTGNNLSDSEQGSTDEQLIRLTSVDYSDGISSPAGEDRASARAISNAVFDQTESIENDRNLSDFVWIWGQFIDHDIDLTEGADPAESFNIEVPLGDADFDPFFTGTAEITLNRSAYDETTGTSVGNPRQQINQITAFLDGSVIYGSDQERADALRTFVGGRLKTSDGDLLPFNEDGLANAGGTSDALFLAGDVRANENIALTSMQTLWVREHNRIADDIAARNPNLSDEQVFQQARSIVTAELQAITYNEFLPALLGRGAISRYDGYDANVDASIANVFSTAAYRLGHSLLSSELVRLDADGHVTSDGNIALRDAFFNPGEVSEQGIDSLLRGAATQTAQELDAQVIDDVRNFLFGPPGAGGFDLVSLNIQRGRDHGLSSYNQARMDLGLTPATSFADISSDPEVQSRLASIYDSVDDVDVWVGGLAEDHVQGSSVGELFQNILVDQFERIRDGDRLWYQNQFSGQMLDRIENTSLADVIERNTDVTGLQDNVFFVGDTAQDRPTRMDLLGRAHNGDLVVGASDGNHFDTRQFGHWNPNADWHDVFVADVNGDGLDDLVGRNGQGQWHVGVSDGRDFQTTVWGHWGADIRHDVQVADVDGDGNADIVGRSDSGVWQVARSNGVDGFTNEAWGYWVPQAGWSDVQVADVDGDGNDDLIGRSNQGVLWVAHSNGSDQFTNERWGYWVPQADWRDVEVADVDGDGNDDLVGRTAGGALWVARSNGVDRLTNEYWGSWSNLGWQDVSVADINGDGNDDIVGRTSNGRWWGAISDGEGAFDNQLLTVWADIHWNDVVIGDIDRDGDDDIIGRTDSGAIWVARSDGTSADNEFWGNWGPGQFDDILIGNFSGDRMRGRA